jgi:transposase
MALGVARTGDETRQVQMVSLDELVGGGCKFRRIERLVSWAAVRASAEPFYTDFGRPSVDPVVLVKLVLVGAVEGIGSMRRVLRVAEDSLAIRRFLGYGLTEALPSHATVSHAQTRRFAGSSVFEQLFTQVLAQCRAQGLLDGGRLVVDATHVEADAALKSLRAELSVVDGDGDGDGDGEDRRDDDNASGGRPRLALAAPRSGPTPKRTASNATAVSISDRDAKLRHKPGQRAHLVHRVQVATDPKARVIVAVHAERATGHEGDALPALIARARWAGHRVLEVCADQGYAGKAVYQQLDALGVVAFIPPQAHQAKKGIEAQAARRRCKAPAGVGAAIDRMTHGEGAISELKLQHGLDRARRRGTPALQLQALVAATAINLKRLMSRPEAAHGTDADDGHHAARRNRTLIQRCARWLTWPTASTALTSSTAS